MRQEQKSIYIFPALAFTYLFSKYLFSNAIYKQEARQPFIQTKVNRGLAVSEDSADTLRCEILEQQ